MVFIVQSYQEEENGSTWKVVAEHLAHKSSANIVGCHPHHIPEPKRNCWLVTRTRKKEDMALSL